MKLIIANGKASIYACVTLYSATFVPTFLFTFKRVGEAVPVVVVYLYMHELGGWVSEIEYGLIAVARGSFTS